MLWKEGILKCPVKNRRRIEQELFRGHFSEILYANWQVNNFPHGKIILKLPPT
jgi:hypothetical protein